LIRRVRELDVVRFVAIGAVVATHYRTSSPAAWPLAYGWAGVDCFFAISGFLITAILIELRGTPNAFRIFYGRRCLRIFPPYYLVIALLVGAAVLFHQAIPLGKVASALTFTSAFRPSPFGTIWAHLCRHVPFQTQSRGFPQGMGSTIAGAFTIFWSLSVEEVFYLLWAPIMLLASRRAIMFSVVVPLIACPLFRLFAHTENFTEYSYFVARVDSLMMGACVALLFCLYRLGNVTRSRLHAIFAVGLLSSCAALVGLGVYAGVDIRTIDLRSLISFSVFGYTMLSLLFSSAVGLCVSFSGNRIMAPLRLSPLVYIGKISYSAYLIHLPVALAVLATMRLEHLNAGAAFLATAAVILVSSLSWTYVESPILKLKDRIFLQPAPARNRLKALEVSASANQHAEAKSIA
jgi:peptidoglycan/LPS O-acetylase OafA/YrhL